MLTRKSTELVDTMIRRRSSLVQLQETGWLDEKSKEIGKTSYKLWYTGMIMLKWSRDIIGKILNKNMVTD